MSVYDDIHCLENFGMISGSYKVLYIDCINDDGTSINLSDSSSFGCDFLFYGTGEVAFTVNGVVTPEINYRMKIELKSELTEDLGNCCLEYVPFIYSGENIIKLGKGRIVIEEA